MCMRLIFRSAAWPGASPVEWFLGLVIRDGGWGMICADVDVDHFRGDVSSGVNR